MYGKKRYFIILLLLMTFNFFVHNSLFLHYSNITNRKKIIVPNGKFVNIALPDNIKPFFSDILWVKLTNNININKKDKRTGENLFKYMMLITDLDPYFYLPYILGGSFLPSKNGYNLFDKGIVLLKKGIKNLPEKWQLTFLTGYFYFFEQNDKDTGFKYFAKCLKIKTTPDSIKALIPLVTLKFSSNERKIIELERLLKNLEDRHIKRLIIKILKRLKNSNYN